MYPVTATDKAFFGRSQKAVMTNDIEWLSGAISYPLVLKQSAGNITLNNSGDFKQHSASILPQINSLVAWLAKCRTLEPRIEELFRRYRQRF